MNKTTCPLNSLEESLNFDSRDWSSNKKDAWIYGIISGWDEDSLKEISQKFNWDKETVNHLKDLHFKFNGLKYMGESSSDLKAVFMGEFYFEEEFIDPETEEETQVKKYIPWTTLKNIFKSMSSYIKVRKKEDYRP